MWTGVILWAMGAGGIVVALAVAAWPDRARHKGDKQ
jgi:hypothetical protein